MRVTGSRAYSRPAPVPKMPTGLVELMEGLTKDVLKHNPSDVYEFCADHMLKLLEIRDGPSNTKPLSLEQKILRAQEKVKKRSEQRWRKYKEELLEKVPLENVSDGISSQPSEQANPTVNKDDENIVQALHKPVHEDHDLTQTTEIDISCESNNTEATEPRENVEIEEASNITETEKPYDTDTRPLAETHEDGIEEEQEQVLQIKDITCEDKVCDDEKTLEVTINEPNEHVLEDGNNPPYENKNEDQEEIQHENEKEQKGVHENNIKPHNLHNSNESPETLDLNGNTEDNVKALILCDGVEEKKVIDNPKNVVDAILENTECTMTPEAEFDTAHVKNDNEPERDQSQNNLVETVVKSQPSIAEDQSYMLPVNLDETKVLGNELNNEKLIKNQTSITEGNSTMLPGNSDDTKITENESNNKKNVESQLNNAVDGYDHNMIPDHIEEPKVFDNISREEKVIKSQSIISESEVVSEYTDDTKKIENDLNEDFKLKPQLDDLVNIEVKSTQETVTLENNGKKSNVSINYMNKPEQIETTIDLPNTKLTENVLDLETVVNDAIENIKRKDSSADDSLKDIHILNEEESDASECSNSNVVDIMAVNMKEKNSNVSETNGKDVDATILTENNILNDKPNESEHIEHLEIVQESIIDENSTISLSSVQCEGSDNANEITSEHSGDETRNDNPNAMDLETAAVTIQKVFRTFLFKSRASTFEDTNDENNLSDDDQKKDEEQFLPHNINKERRTLGLSRMDTVLQTVNEEKSLSLSTDDSSLSSAATIIQAHVRGFLVRNKLHHGKTTSSNSLAISTEPSGASMDGDVDHNKSKTILNIHIVPEGGNYLSRDESMITSMDLSLDGSPPSSVNLHPHGYNTSERRKQLKREDAVQSVSPPSNNSGKLSEDVDSVKELTINVNEDSNIDPDEKNTAATLVRDTSRQETEAGSIETTPTTSLTMETVVGDSKTPNMEILSSPEPITEWSENRKSLTKQSSDEMDVVTPFKENNTPRDATPKLLHSGEFHDAALPTKVSRSDTPVASEFKNVLVYFLLWNKTTHSSI